MNAWDTLGNPGCGRHDIKPYLCKFHQASESSNSIREFLHEDRNDQEDQGSSGPVQVSFGKPIHAVPRSVDGYFW